MKLKTGIADSVKSTGIADFLKKGGAGSGNFGHSGRAGEVGGSGEGGGKSDAEHISRLTQAASDAKARGNTGAAKEWANNARNLKGNDETLKQDARMASMSIQDKPGHGLGGKTPQEAQDSVARQTARMPEAMRGVMGGQNHDEAAMQSIREAGLTRRGSDQLRSGLGRKQFEAVATNIRSRQVDDATKQSVAESAARFLKLSNPLFNEERFINAATGKGSQAPGRLGHTSSTAAGIRQSARNMGRNAPEPTDKNGYTAAQKEELRAERAAGLINIDLRRKTGTADLKKDAVLGFSADWSNVDNCQGCQEAESGGPYDDPDSVPDPGDVCLLSNGEINSDSECSCTIDITTDAGDLDGEIPAADFDAADYTVD